MFLFKVLSWGFALALNPLGAAVNPEKLLQMADEIRNPSEAYRMTVSLQDEDRDYAYEVLVKGKDKSIVVSKKPAREAGRNMLMLERDFYLYMPNLKRSLRLSLSQKLAGQVSYGDIARTRWYGDYNVEKSEEAGNEVLLALVANKTGLTYERIELRVDMQKQRPLSAQYKSRDGKLVLKTAYFEDYKNLAGKERPSKIRIQDVGGKESVLHIESMKAEALSDSLFSQSRLSSFK
jgi:hypothetical protein